MGANNYSKTDVIKFLKTIKILSIGLTPQVTKALQGAGVDTLYDLCETDYLKFRTEIRGLGVVGQKEVQARMGQLGLRFRWNEDSPYVKLFSNELKENCNTDYEEVNISRILDLVMRWESEQQKLK